MSRVDRSPGSVLTVGELLERAELEVTVVAGLAGLSRTVTVPRIQKPGLALTGWPEQLHPNRVLVLGGTEIEYLIDHPPARDRSGIETLLASEPGVRRGLPRPRAARSSCSAAAEARGVPLLVSTLVTADFIAAVTAWMADQLAPSTELHGVLMDVLGIGVLLLGKSGIGKSETALDLVVRGHRLVADDIVRDPRQERPRRRPRRRDPRPPHGDPRPRHHQHQGPVRHRRRARRQEDRARRRAARVGRGRGVRPARLRRSRTSEILGVEVPQLRLPVRPGRNLATLIEVAARNQLLKLQGTHSARAFRDQLHRAMADAEAATPMDTVE